jgi:translation initiation factor IF-2
VEIRPHSIIYEVSDEIKKAMTGLLEPVFKETHLGRAEVRDTFRVKGVGMIAGCYVLDGVLKRDADVRVLRDGAVVYTGRISFAAPLQGRCQRSALRIRMRRQRFQLQRHQSGRHLECFHMQKLMLAEATA